MAASISIFTEDGQTTFDIHQDVASYIEGLIYKIGAAEQQRDTLAKAIAEAAQKSGGYNGEVELSGPQLLQLLDEMADQLKAAQEQEPVCWRRPDDTGHWIYRDDNPSKSGLIWDALYTAPIPAQQSKEIRGSNEYGLDMGYLEGKLNILLRDIDRHRPDEAARVLARLAKVADEKVLSEPEFAQQSPAVAVPDHVIAKTINKLRDVAVKYHGTQQLREQIASIIRPLLNPSPRITEQDVREI